MIPCVVHLRVERGSLFATGDFIDSVAVNWIQSVPESYRLKQEARDGKHYHITVVQKKEMTLEAQEELAKVLKENVTIGDLVPLGLGRIQEGENEAMFVVVFSEQLNLIRRRILKSDSTVSTKDFHTTLGFAVQDIHSKSKSVKTLCSPRLPLSKESFQSLLGAAWNAVSRTDENIDVLLEVLEYCMRLHEEQGDLKVARLRKINVLDVLCALYVSRNEFSRALSCSESLHEVSEVRGLVRKCQALKGLNDSTKANFAGIRALELLLDNNPEDQSKAIGFLKLILSDVDCPVDSRCVPEDHEQLVAKESPWKTKSYTESLQLANRIHKEFTSEPQQRWELNPESATCRRCVYNPITQALHRLPRLFSWLVPQRLCGMSTPRNEEDISAIAFGLGVGLVVSLTRESPLPKEWFKNKPCCHLFLPVENFEPPSFPQVDEFLLSAAATMLKGKAVLVHCGGGKGRAGTMLACWLIRMGGAFEMTLDDNGDDHHNTQRRVCVGCTESRQDNSEIFCDHDGCLYARDSVRELLNRKRFEGTFTPKQAIDALQLWRPGSIETKQQEQFLHDYSSEMWRRNAGGNEQDLLTNQSSPSSVAGASYDPAPAWTASTEPLIVRHAKQAATRKSSAKVPSLIVAMGLPGSGKSYLGRLLHSSLRNRCSVISGDELGGRSAVETAIGHAVKDVHSVTYVDRCHVDQDSRIRVLDLAFRPSDACLVFMDVSKSECVNRARSRLNHPTIPQGSGEGIIESFAKRMNVPVTGEQLASEGFSKMYHIKSKRAFEEMCSEWNLALLPEDKTTGGNELNKDKAMLTAKKASLGSCEKSIGLPGFTKFPRTAHLLRMSEKSVSRDDLLVGDSIKWLQQDSKCRITVEEKIDGANVGISVDPETLQLRVQNRSHYVSSGDHPQFGPLSEWMAMHKFELQSLLQAVKDMFDDGETNPILFGEWIVARHSIAYNAIPDYFVAFDILLPNGKFASRKLFHALLQEHCSSIFTVPALFTSDDTAITVDLLKHTVSTGKSKFRVDSGQLEGVYVRIDDEQYLRDRAKVVRADFIAGNEHWTKHSFQRNVLIVMNGDGV